MPVAVMRSRTEAPSGGACRNADSSAQSGSSPSAESGSARVSLLRLGRGTAGCWSPLRAAPSVAAREWIEALTIEVEALDLGCTGEDVSVVGKWDGGAACCWTTGPGGATDRYLTARGYYHGPLFCAEKNYVGGRLRMPPSRNSGPIPGIARSPVILSFVTLTRPSWSAPKPSGAASDTPTPRQVLRYADQRAATADAEICIWQREGSPGHPNS